MTDSAPPLARTVVALFGAGLLLTAGCTSSGGTSSGGPGTFQDPVVPAGEFRLVSFDSCEEAAELLRAATREHVGSWGLGGYPVPADGAGLDAAESAPDAARGAAPAAPAAPAGPEEPGAGPGYSGTNVHEKGVDEPDLVKTDGRRIVTVSQGVLRVVDAERKVETGSVDLFASDFPGEPEELVEFADDLLLYGDHALVLVRQSYWWLEPGAGIDRGGREPETAPDPSAIAGPLLLLVDLAGPPQVVSEYTMDGSLVDARAVGSTVRVVVRSTPRFDFPQGDPNATDKERIAANQKVVDAADLSAWLPRYEVTTGDDTTTGQVDCTAMSRPASYTGTSMLTVLTFDLAAPELEDGVPVSVVADGDTVYSNGPSLYVASDKRWQAIPAVDIVDDGPLPEIDDRTEIHKFDTSQPGPPRYAASGAVAGWLINQYAMSEWDGHLRVATTSGEDWWGEQGETESTVYVLAERDGELAVTGSVGGLGKGERIYSVRFAGPVGYVVTFRETDPLYTVNLADPEAPAVLGELKITGYSAYLHPIDGSGLIGVGQEADQDGRVQGTQVSLFDVSDLADPQVQAQHHVPNGNSVAEFDPHAFLWWPAERLLVLPLYTYDGNSSALVLRADGAGFTELARITHPGSAGEYQAPQILRSLVIGDTLWTYSGAGLAAHRLSTLEQIGWVGF